MCSRHLSIHYYFRESCPKIKDQTGSSAPSASLLHLTSYLETTFILIDWSSIYGLECNLERFFPDSIRSHMNYSGAVATDPIIVFHLEFSVRTRSADRRLKLGLVTDVIKNPANKKKRSEDEIPFHSCITFCSLTIWSVHSLWFIRRSDSIHRWWSFIKSC